MIRFYQVCYFGILAERRGHAEEQIRHDATTPAELYQDLNTRFSLGLAAEDIRAAVNDEFASWSHPLKDGDRIAFLPPMSGG
ncbi:MAG: MoaD/ThiS family protein [Gloeobacteraceae cyanobacterium ES-bin-144]|nr:MoaD/ThiS family protein [Verrucomicrobiales bacterium]